MSEPRVLLIGMTGVGKSCIGCALAARPGLFAIGHAAQSCTTEPSEAAGVRIGARTYTLIDSAGCCDTNGAGADEANLTRLVRFLDGKAIDVIALVVDFGAPRFTELERAMVRLFDKVFRQFGGGRDPWASAVVLLNKADQARVADFGARLAARRAALVGELEELGVARGVAEGMPVAAYDAERVLAALGGAGGGGGAAARLGDGSDAQANVARALEAQAARAAAAGAAAYVVRVPVVVQTVQAPAPHRRSPPLEKKIVREIVRPFRKLF